MPKRPEISYGSLCVVLGDYYEAKGYSYEESVEAFQTWAEQEKEDAHIEALEGALAQLRIREDFLEVTGDPTVTGFRAARLRVQHAMGTLSAVYKNRRRFAARDRAKAAADGNE